MANARWGEKHPGREEWVKQQATLLLNSQWKEVLAQWQEILDTQKLSTHQAYNVQRAITYVTNRPHMLDYKSYLDKGYPITTGAVESACGHFVKIGPPMRQNGEKCYALGKTRCSRNAQYQSNQKKWRLAGVYPTFY